MKSFFQLLLVLIVLVIKTSNTLAQAPYHKWVSGLIPQLNSSAIQNAIAVDANGNVYTTGSFIGTVDFDPGPGTANLSSISNTVFDFYITKMDANGAYVWAKAFGNGSNIKSKGIAVDGSGNVYTVGYFGGQADFDPGPNVVTLTSTGNGDIFISKLDMNGNYVWAKHLGGADSDEGGAIAVDGSGNVYTTGVFQNTADFDPGPGVANQTCVGGLYGIFISKLNTNGNYVWAKAISSTTANDYGKGIAVDAGGNVYTTGYFGGTADFDPSPGTANLTGPGVINTFISKLDANGAYVWAKCFGGTGSDMGRAIASDGQGNVYTTGIYFGTSDFDPGPGVANMSSVNGLFNTFIIKLDASGSYVWARSIGGEGYAIGVDGNGSVYTTGAFDIGQDFDPGVGTATLNSAGSNDIFISKLDSNGIYSWARAIGSNNFDEGYGLALDGNGNIYTTGRFGSTVDFDPGSATSNLVVTYSSSSGGYVLKWGECSTASLAATTTTAVLTTMPIGGNTMPIGFIGGCADILRLRPFGANPVSGRVSSTVYILNSAPTFNGQTYVRRYYDITPATFAATATATVTLYFTQADFTNYNSTSPAYPLPTGPSDGTGIANLSIAVEHGTSATGLPGSYTWTGSGPKNVIIDPVNANVVWNSNTSRWEVTFDVIGFSGYYAFGSANATLLPITLESFSAKPINDREVLLSWQTATEKQNTLSYMVERSPNGVVFSEIGSVNPTAATSYTLHDYQPLNGRSYYRLRINGTSSHAEYSKVETVFIGKSSYTSAYPSSARDYIEIETNEAGVSAALYDMQGRVVMNIGAVQNGARVKVTRLAPGIYVLRCSNGYSLKISKE